MIDLKKIYVSLSVLTFSVVLGCTSPPRPKFQGDFLSKDTGLSIELSAEEGVFVESSTFTILDSSRYDIRVGLKLVTESGQSKRLRINSDFYGLVEVKDAENELLKIIHINDTRVDIPGFSNGEFLTDIIMLKAASFSNPVHLSVKEMSLPIECQSGKCVVEFRISKFNLIK